MTAFFHIDELSSATGGVVRQRGAREQVAGVSTDSRTAQAGEVFIPLAGERFDGHDFIPRALGRQIGALIVHDAWYARSEQLPANVAVITVSDTLTALGDLAAAWRRRFAIPVTAITGSCGKTTTKEMAALVLSEGFRVWKNEMNINNLIGVPQTLLGLTGEHQTAVIEMGMNRFGEIRRLAHLVQPAIGVLTNVYPAHTEGLGSLTGVAQAKSELLEALGESGTLIYNHDDCLLSQAAARHTGRTLSFGLGAGAALRVTRHRPLGLTGQEVDFCYQGRCWPAFFKIPGLHHLYNALGAAAIGLTLGLTPEQISNGLAKFTSLDKRTQVLRLGSGAQLINDCYNANPGSMGQALQTLAQARSGGRVCAALGDMLELGEATTAAHTQVGALAARLDLDVLVVCGQFRHHVVAGAQAAGMPACRIFPVASHAEGAQVLAELLGEGDIILVKGSRGMRMEHLIAQLQ